MSEPGDDALRVVVVTGGVPTAEQAAALAAALLRSATDAPEWFPTRHRWRAAALREGIGGARIADPGQLRELTGRR